MVGLNFLASIIIVLVILLISHLTVDRDIPDSLKTGAWIFFGALTLGYIIFGIIM